MNAPEKTARGTGQKITISGAFGSNRDTSSDDLDVRKNGLTYIVDCLRLAEALGSPEAASIWRPLAGSPDELARQGLDFYKSLFR